MRNQNPFFSGLGALVLSQVWKAHAFPMESTSTSGIVSVPMFVDDRFWFANFSVGASDSVTLLLDTGSADLLLSPGVYTPGPTSENLDRAVNLSFSTTNSDGSGHISATVSIFNDTVKLSLPNSPLVVPQQELGVSTAFVFPHDGILGLSNIANSAIDEPGWFENLCAQTPPPFPECRFGIALDTDGTGTAYLGGVKNETFVGELTTVPIDGQWTIFADMVVDGVIYERGAELITDSGTGVILGPSTPVMNMFKALNLRTENSTIVFLRGLNATMVTAYYPCDSPPTFGFGLPSLDNVTAEYPESKLFNVLDSALVQERNGTECEMIVHGVDTLDTRGFWLVGQPFFQGKYVDHRYAGEGSMGFAELRKGYGG